MTTLQKEAHCNLAFI